MASTEGQIAKIQFQSGKTEETPPESGHQLNHNRLLDEALAAYWSFKAGQCGAEELATVLDRLKTLKPRKNFR
jgi:Uma2 family endonuclease